MDTTEEDGDSREDPETHTTQGLQYQAWLEGVMLRKWSEYLNRCRTKQPEPDKSIARDCFLKAARTRPYCPDRVIMEVAETEFSNTQRTNGQVTPW